MSYSHVNLVLAFSISRQAVWFTENVATQIKETSLDEWHQMKSVHLV